MRESKYQDSDGRWWAVMLPDGASDRDASMGIPLGPPSLQALGLPSETEVRLHNQLFSRRVFTAQDARKMRQNIFGALQSALKIDVSKVVDVYLAQGGQSYAKDEGPDVKRVKVADDYTPAPKTRRRQ